MDIFLLLPSRAASWIANFEGSSMVDWGRLSFVLKGRKVEVVLRSKKG